MLTGRKGAVSGGWRTLKTLVLRPTSKLLEKEFHAMLRKFIAPSFAVLVLTALTACGYSPGHRALTGGAIGAGGGAIIGGATGMGAGTGALIGAGAGALTGAATTHSQLNLGN
jgi:osmotically inducible lipoprotein OsmB